MEGQIVRTIKDFLTTKDEELCVNRDEYLQVIKKVDRHWVKCRKGVCEGLIPSSHVTQVENIPKLSENQRIFISKNDCPSDGEGQLSFVKGTILVGLEILNGGEWCNGYLLDDNGRNKGIFPISYCWQLDPFAYLKEDDTSSAKTKILKFAQVIHGMTAQLDEEIDLIEGQMVVITEFIDKDWYRGECNGRTGTFPASFVRIVDSFPGDIPPKGADLRSYIKAQSGIFNDNLTSNGDRRNHNDYMNTQNAFPNLTESLKALEPTFTGKTDTQMANDISLDSNNFLNVITHDTAFKESNDRLLPNLPKSMLEDNYFKQNLPATYGTVSLPPSENETDLDDFVFEKDYKLCSKGYQEMSDNLTAFGQSNVSWTASYQHSDVVLNDHGEDNRFENRKGRLLTAPGYGQLNENFSSIFNTKENDMEKEMPEDLFDTNVNNDFIDRNCILRMNETKKSDINSVHPYHTASIPGISNNNHGASKSTHTMENHNNIKELTEVFSFDPVRYQNVVTYDNLGEQHSAISVDVRPYGIAKYNFLSQFDNELSLQEGDMVYLRKYIDEEWMEGEVDGKRGLVPIGYVNIIVDCLEVVEKPTKDLLQPSYNNYEPQVTLKDFKNTNILLELDPLVSTTCIAVVKESKIKPGTYHKVSFTFQAQMDGDLNIVEGEVIRVLEKGNENVHWLNVENSYGERGLCPANHLDPTEEFDGKVLFDIDRLLSYKNKKEQIEPQNNKSSCENSTLQAACKSDLKFFDPLCSPDNDMLIVEAELERRAKEANTLPIHETVARKKKEQLARLSAFGEAQQDTDSPLPPDKKKLRNKDTATDIDDFISTNISKLASPINLKSLKKSNRENSALLHSAAMRSQSNTHSNRTTNPFLRNSHFVPAESSIFNSNKTYVNVCTRNKVINEAHIQKDTSNLASSQLDISKSILMELRGNRPKPRKPAPPRPPEPLTLNRPQKNSSIPPPKPPPPLRNANSNITPLNQDNGDPNFVNYITHSTQTGIKQGRYSGSISETESGGFNETVEEPVYAKVKKSLTSTDYLTEPSMILERRLSTNTRLSAPPGRKPPRPPKLKSTAAKVPSTEDNENSRTEIRCALEENNLVNTNRSSAQDGLATLTNLEDERNLNFIQRYDDVYSTKGSVIGKNCTGVTDVVIEEPQKESTTPTNEKSYDETNESECLEKGNHSALYGITNTLTPMEENTRDLVPKVPQRTSSCSMRKVIDEWHQRNINNNVKSLNSVATSHAAHQNSETKREGNNSSSRSGYMNVSTIQTTNNGKFHSSSFGNELTSTPFPPDRDSLMSPPPSENPPKIQTLPYRCVSVGSSSIKSRSVFYATVPSDRVESPSYSSLNHSYETLNMSDTGDTISVVVQNTDNDSNGKNVPRMPHRPAPPVPCTYKMTAMERKYLGEHLDEYNSQLEYEEWKGTMARSGSQMTIDSQKQTHNPMSRRTLRERKIHSVKRQIQIKEKMLEEQLLRELDMYQEIAVAKGAEYDKLNKKMDKCQDNIEKLSDDIQRLQACLGDEELKAEEESIEETQRREEEQSRRSQLEVQTREEEKRIREERIAKNKERRENVINELAMTERDFCRDLKLTWQAFGLDTPAMLEQRNVDVNSLFGNLSDIIEVSESFLDSLQLDAKNKPSVSEENVGSCFLQHADDMKTAYTDYCVNHDKAEQLMEKYEATPDISRLLQRGVETIQAQVSCFNMGSILIKPVQRILKYPLILNELVKCTEEDHSDREDLSKAVSIMSNIAAFINESKRRKDIVDKYRTEEDKTLTRRISKLNMHSINKKSTRMSQRIFSSLGMETTFQAKDAAFEDHEKRFNDLKESVQAFSNDATPFREQLHDAIVCQYNVAQNVADLYTARIHTREVERFKASHKKIISTYWNEFDTKLQTRVLKPLQALLETFIGPSRLIQKRQDKYLDYSASQQKAEKNKDQRARDQELRSKNLQEEVERCKSTYDALNSQLLEELPKFLKIGTDVYVIAIKEFISNRRLFVGRITQELLSLMDLPLLASTTGDIIEVFLVKHSMVCNQISRFAFSSKTLRNVNSEENPISPQGTQQQYQKKNLIQSSNQKIHSPSRSSHNSSCATLQIYLPSSPTLEHSKSKQALSSTSDKSNTIIQTVNTRMLLRGKYASAKLFQANQAYNSKQPMEVTVQAGDLVGVIQQKDPMGDGSRWYVDIGVVQGFLPTRVLSAIGDDQDSVKHPNFNSTLKETSNNKILLPQDQPLEERKDRSNPKTNDFDNISPFRETNNEMDKNKDQRPHVNKYLSSDSNETETCNETQESAIENTVRSTEVITTAAVVHAYDDVASEDTDEQNAKQTKTKPVRKAPAPPASTSIQKLNNEKSDGKIEQDESYAATEGASSQDNVEVQDEIYGTTGEIDDEVEKGSSITVNSNSSGNSNSNDYSTNVQIGQDADIERNGSHHSYEEIPPSEANSEPSQDLSPIYEEIHGGSRSSVSSGSGSSGGVGHRSVGLNRLQHHVRHEASDNNNPIKAKFYYSLYEFQATDQAVMLTLTKGQVVRIIPETNSSLGSGLGNSGLNDWCYAEDRYANRGYVPRQFLKLYDLGNIQPKGKK